LEPEDPVTETWSTLPWLPQEPAPPAESEPEPVPLHASKKRTVLLVAGCTGLVVVAVLGALFVIGSGKIASAKRNVNDLNRQVESLAPPNAERQQVPAEQRAQIRALTAALASRVSWDRVFRDVSLVLPKDVRLTSLTGGTAPPKFTIRGRTPWYQSLDRLVAGLRGEPELRNVELVSSTRSKVGSRQVLGFTIAADVASPTEGGS
jgi:Tfp pilus assembly protein PilN